MMHYRTSEDLPSMIIAMGVAVRCPISALSGGCLARVVVEAVGYSASGVHSGEYTDTYRTYRTPHRTMPIPRL